MEWIETSGDTVEDAIEAALDKLGVSKKELEYEIVEEAKSGLFRKKEAQIRARIKPLNTKTKKTRKPRAAKKEKVEKKQIESSVSIEDQQKIAFEFCAHVLGYFDPEGTVNSRIEDDSIYIDCEGPSIGVLIGEKGLTATALEELIRVKLKRECEGVHNRTYLDVGGYKKKRKEALVQFSSQVIEKVKSSNEEHIFEPMSSSDRKVIHDVVAETEGVGSTSRGYEPRRRVVVFVENAK